MFARARVLLAILAVFAALLLLHVPFLSLPYFWDEAGYYVPAALDFYHSWELIPVSTLPTGHTPLVMVYLALAWHAFGFSTLVTRAAMLLLAAASVTSLWALARRVAGREAALWSATLLALSPMFFAQSSLVYLDPAAALFTTLAVLALLERRLGWFALTASLAVLSKETAVVLLPVAWVYTWWQHRAGRGTRSQPAVWIAVTLPLLPLLAWALYYHHRTGFWTGNAEYLQYNLYSTLEPQRIFWSLLRRLYETLIGGFNWLLAAGATLGIWWGQFRKPRQVDTEAQRVSGKGLRERGGRTEAGEKQDEAPAETLRAFVLLMAGLGAAYLIMLSVVGGAILPRYLLPIVPLCYLLAVALIERLPKALARSILAVAAACFVGAWFINPPYPFPYEDNLSYADFIRLHQQAAQFLESQPTGTRILTAWPATDELKRPFLGYVDNPLRVVPIEGLTEKDLDQVSAEAFDLLYLYSRKWEPPDNCLRRFPHLLKVQERYFDYAPQVEEETLKARYHVQLLRQFRRRGQWVRIYSR
jgi:4-amino-4-deoxy-L-arabinose transferase-like glycosyltransferase